MYNKNNKGPKVIPRGIPLVTKGLEGGEAQRQATRKMLRLIWYTLFAIFDVNIVLL